MLSAAKKVNPLQLMQSQLLTAQDKLSRAHKNIEASIRTLIETLLIDGKKAYFLSKISPLLEAGPAGSGYLAYVALKEEISLKINQFSQEKLKTMSELQEQDKHINAALIKAETYLNELYSYSSSYILKEATDLLSTYPSLLKSISIQECIARSASITNTLENKIADAIKAHQESIKHSENVSERIKALEEQVAALKKENAELKAHAASSNAAPQSTPAMFKPK